MAIFRSKSSISGNTVDADVVLIGGGIMSATLGAMLATLQPEWSITLLERRPRLAEESSDPWNNAGTGHSGFCELNYMPDPADPTVAINAGRQFRLTRQWWAHLADTGLLPGFATTVHSTPHMDVVFGQRDVDYLRRRHATLQASPLFADMEYTENREVIAHWAPLLMEGRPAGDPVAATRYLAGTDVDFGALTHGLSSILANVGGEIRTEHEVMRLRRRADGRWDVRGRDLSTGREFTIRSRFVFVGAGGYALRLLQKSRIPEVRGYGVFPVGAAFLRTGNPDVVGRHESKVYSQAGIGAPPMSVPHLDKRVVDGKGFLLFGPYATFSTRLLKHGRRSDFFSTLRWHNLPTLIAAGLQSFPLLRYLISQLRASPESQFAELKHFYPTADPADWELIQAGQRAQLVTPDRRKIGVLKTGTEVVTGADGTIAGLLGASPGASTAVPIMIDLLERCFPNYWTEWEPILAQSIPAMDHPIDADQRR